MTENESRIVIAGAGSIGCYVGGCLAAADKNVVFLVRPRVDEALRQGGLRIVDLDGTERLVSPEKLQLAVDPAAAFASAEIILVTVKSGATEEMAKLIAAHAPSSAVVVSLQNGVDNAKVLRRTLPKGFTVAAGMVPFNVVQSEPGEVPLTVRRTTEGTILIDDKPGDLADELSVPGLKVANDEDMQGVLWGKLLMNLNNAANALSNLPLAAELSDRNWRRLLADQMNEGIKVLKAHGIAPAKIQGLPPALLPWILRLPDFLFGILARKMLSVGPHARSSMWEDLSRGRPTEIDYLQGVILRLAQDKKIDVPLTRRIIARIREAEGKPLRSHTVEEIRNAPV
ncbi:2-dehydropantoate 2-reductase [Phyllobacterium sp. SYP-B3895]|uniref:2-dehydropantoate 2-reductase n=1 Tax=Phyllobacterium sp. SYP-B3895 TaxID=2663240 RepID=UPI001299E0E1|nr:2-dehydropantoate 2-reductase [Phyllobacterium sp. SYP-B3895]MRG54167.1 2-dehydropantoate 2-reductase [Phyllobacterium sp. SYP-B3895]